MATVAALRAPAGTHEPEGLADSLDGAAGLRAPCVGDRVSLPQPRGPKQSPSGSRGWGNQSSPAFFQCTLLAARRAVPPPRPRSGSAGTQPGPGVRSSKPCAPPLGWVGDGRTQDLPRALPAADPTLHARTQCPRARCPLRSARPPAGAFGEPGAISSFPPLRGGLSGRRAASRWPRTQGQVPLPIRLGSGRAPAARRGASPGVGEVASRRRRRRREGGWVCTPASDEGGDRRRDEAPGSSLGSREGPPLCPVPLRSSPTRGRAAGSGRRGPGRPSFSCLSASPSHDRSPLASAQTFL